MEDTLIVFFNPREYYPGCIFGLYWVGSLLSWGAFYPAMEARIHVPYWEPEA